MYYRCGRSDVAFATVCMSRRIETWSDRCRAAMKHVIGCIVGSKSVCLHMVKSKLDKMSDMRHEVATDSDWILPRSQPGVHSAVVPANGTLVPVSFLTHVQSIVADSTPAAESIAGYAGIKDAYAYHDELMRGCLHGKVYLVMDNQSADAAFNRGYSAKLCHHGKAIGLKFAFVKQQIDEGNKSLNT